MKQLTRLMALLLAVTLCILPAQAMEPQEVTDYFTEWSEGLDEIMAQYMAEHRLNESNFSMGYLYTKTGEYWYYNEEKMMNAGSLYKLPLNMRIVDKVAAGERSYYDYVDGMPLASAQYLSVNLSDNDVSHALQRYLVGYSSGYYRAYRRELLAYSGWSEEEIPWQFLSSNSASAEYMMRVLVHLYGESELYGDLIAYMKDAYPGSYFRLYEGDYAIAHKYGMTENFLHDAAIVYTPNPFLLVVMTDSVYYSEQRLGELCRMMTEYTLGLDAKYEAERQAEIDEAEQLALTAEAADLAASELERGVAQLAVLSESAVQTVTELAELVAFSTLRLCFP